MEPNSQSGAIDLKKTGALPAAPRTELQLRNTSDYRIILNLIEKYHPEISDDNFESCQRNILRHLDILRSGYPNLEDLRGKFILDLACGSRNYSESSNKAYEPWMPRLILELGGNVVGIDLAPQENEDFKSYQVDLTKINSLAFLPGSLFDACHMDGFPTRNAINAFVADGVLWEDLKENLNHHMQRLLKPAGIILQGFTKSCEDFVAMSLPKRLRPSPDEEL